MDNIPLFVVKATGLVNLYRRTYEAAESTDLDHYHDARISIGQRNDLVDDEGYVSFPSVTSADDLSLWPTACTHCGHVFGSSAVKRYCAESIYRNPLTGETWSMNELPPGALYDAFWLRGSSQIKDYPDGKIWTVVLPNRVCWTIDYPSSRGGHWTRTGEAPNLTVHPSIDTPGYHGWVTNGRLLRC